MAKIFAPTNPEMSEREKRNFARVRHIAAQGMVLLKNNGVLPLAADGRKLALFRQRCAPYGQGRHRLGGR